MLDDVKKALIVTLGSAYMNAAQILTNDDGLLFLSTLKDNNGRELLQPNPLEPMKMYLSVGPIKVPLVWVPNKVIPSDIATKGKRKIPIIPADFKEAFSSWTITIDDGTETALSYTESDLNPAPIYWHFGDNITAITVNIRAVTTKGNTVTERRVFQKKDAAEQYEEVGDAVTGGDALEINMGTVESSTGELTGITITANITFENESESVEIPTTNPDEGGDSGTEPPIGGDVTLNLPADVTYSISAGDAPASADAYIASEAGLDKIIVTITAGNDAFQAILVDLKMDGQSFLAENGGVNLIDNSDFGNLVATVGSTAPTDGTKEYTFPIGAFFTFLDMTGATDAGKSHEFHITVTDKNGQKATGVFKVTINE